MAKVYTEEELNNFSRETLMAVILSMQDQIHQLNTNMERLIEQIADANNKRYGRSSEKLETISGQLELELIFNEAEALTETLYVVEPVEEDVIQPRRKNKGKREADLKDLPIEVIVHTLSEEKLQDVFGTDGWKQLPDEIYKRVRVQPAVYTVEEHHVAVYAGKDNQTIIKADRPKNLLRNSLLTPSLAASIMNAKYVNGLPLYRISQEFLRNDIHISRQVMANWMIQCADRYLGILYDRLHKEMYQFHVLQADETPVMVTKDGRPVNSKSYMWIYRTGKSYTDTPIILYEYQRTRKADHPEEFLKDFKGIVVCDGYSAYRKLDRENPDMKEKNLAVELLKKLIAEQVSVYRRTNVVKSEKFSEIMQRSLNAYLNGMLTNEEVIEEMLNLAKQIAAAKKEGDQLGLTADELAFYDALTKPQAIKDFYENEELIAITKELADTLRRNKTIDWQKRESARAKMRMLIKKLLKKHKYPPEGMEDAVQTVMTQCELWTDNNDMGEEKVVDFRKAGYTYMQEKNDVLMVAEKREVYGDMETKIVKD